MTVINPSSGGVDRRQFMAAAALGGSAAVLANAAGAQPATKPPAARRARQPAPSNPQGGVSAVIAAHVVSSRFADLPPSAIEALKLRMLDLAGCAIGGVRGEDGRSLAAAIAAGGGGAASVFGTGLRAAPRDAAMANAVLARTFDFEVMTVSVEGVVVPSHHAPTTVMTALALAEQHRADGKAFLTALAVGDDLAARTLAAAGIDFNDGWDGAPLHATMAAAAIASRFLRLDAQATLHAIGIAADQIGGTVQSIWDGASAWKVQQGVAARNGIFAAELAQAGWSGMADPLLAPCGFYAQFTPGCARPALLTQDLGRSWHGEGYFKPWPSCAANHPAIECALALRERVRLDPASIRSIRIVVEARILELFIAKPLLAGPSPHSQANFSLRFATATALLRGQLRQDDYDIGMRADPALLSLIEHTALAPLPPGGKGVIVEVTLADGSIVSEALPGRPRHYPEVAGSTRAEVEAKFRQQVEFAGNVAGDRAELIARRIANIEHERDMAGFVRILADTIRFPKA